jgi:hypothetical protein
MRPAAQRSRVARRPLSSPTVSLALALGSLAAGCGAPTIDEAAARYVPDTAGVVVENHLSSLPFTFALSDGRTIAIDNGVEFIDRNTPGVGDLLLVGSQPLPWAASVRPAGSGGDWPPGCFNQGGDAFDRGDWVEITITVDSDRAYLRVPKADTWSGTGEQPGDWISSLWVCLNAQGRAFAGVGPGRY